MLGKLIVPDLLMLRAICAPIYKTKTCMAVGRAAVVLDRIALPYRKNRHVRMLGAESPLRSRTARQRAASAEKSEK